jgi:hypothetical protein
MKCALICNIEICQCSMHIRNVISIQSINRNDVFFSLEKMKLRDLKYTMIY